MFWLSFKTGLLQYKELIGLSFFLVSCITIFASIWKEASVKSTESSFSPVDFVWYIALNEWVLVALPYCHQKISDDFKTGQFSASLLRPASYILSKLFESSGELVASLMLLGPVAFLTAWFWTQCCPLSYLEIFLSIGFGVIGGIVGVLAFLTVGFTRFWFVDVVPVYWIFEKFLFLFGGLFLPLQTYPDWLKTITYMMPSFGILGGRSSLIFDSSLMHILFLTLSCLAWGLIFFALCKLMMKKGLMGEEGL